MTTTTTTTTMTTIIKLRNVVKSYDSTKAVNGISFHVEKGEIFAILGPSGCGKTSTLRLIAGFEKPDTGKIIINETPVAGGAAFIPPERRGVGMVSQDYALFPHLNVQKNIAFGLRGLDKVQREEIVGNMLKFVGLKKFAKRYPHQLSGGQQQRTALARALAPCPVVVLLDEPFSNLDTDMRVRMRDEMKEILTKAKTTAVLVTHDQEEAFVIADRIAVMDQGNIEQIGTPEEIYHSPATRFVADFVGQADFIDGIAREEGILTEIGIIQNQEGHPIGEEIELMIRPDDIDFAPDPGGNGIIESRQFRGSENLYHIRMPSGKIVHSARESTGIFEPGTRVAVKSSPTHVVSFKKTDRELYV
jgi:iron(III) transport system ATP-binding protein